MDNILNTNNTVSILNDLITISKDGEQGFKMSAEKVNSEELKTIFMDRAHGCSQAVAQLQRHVEALGDTPTDSGSVLGTLHRGWLEIKSALADADDYAILEECERGEDAAVKAYSKALEGNLPQEIHELVQKQFEVVKQNYAMVCNLKNEYAKKD